MVGGQMVQAHVNAYIITGRPCNPMRQAQQALIITPIVSKSAH
jgi:hypothetical protein